MYKSYLLRGALGFLVGGLFFTQIQSRWPTFPGGIWVSVSLACAVLGMISAFALEGLNEDDRRLKTWSTGGWLVGGLLFCFVFRALSTASVSPALVVVLPALVAGLAGGVGMGMGWRGPKTALLLGTASAVLLPGSLWINGLIVEHVGLALLQMAPLSITWNRICAWTFGLLGFAVYGMLMGLILARHDETDFGPRAGRSRRRALQRLRRSAFTVDASGMVKTSGSRGAQEYLGETEADLYADGPSAMEDMFVGGRAATHGGAADAAEWDEVEPEWPEPPPADFHANRFDRGPEGPEDLSREGTFRSKRRNYHPDYAPEDRDSTHARKLEILRNYHPEFAPETDPAKIVAQHQARWREQARAGDASNEAELPDDQIELEEHDYDFLSEE